MHSLVPDPVNCSVFVRPVAGRYWSSTPGLTAVHAFGTDLNSPFSSVVTYGKGLAEWCVAITKTTAATTHAPMAMPHQRRTRRRDLRSRAAAARPGRRRSRGAGPWPAGGVSPAPPSGSAYSSSAGRGGRSRVPPGLAA